LCLQEDAFWWACLYTSAYNYTWIVRGLCKYDCVHVRTLNPCYNFLVYVCNHVCMCMCVCVCECICVYVCSYFSFYVLIRYMRISVCLVCKYLFTKFSGTGPVCSNCLCARVCACVCWLYVFEMTHILQILMYVFPSRYIHTYVHAYTHNIHIYKYVYTYTYIHIHTYIYIYIYIYIYMHTYIHRHEYTRTSPAIYWAIGSSIVKWVSCTWP